MSVGRQSDAILGQSTGYSQGTQSPVTNVVYGGMHGYIPDLTQYASNTSYLRRNLIPIVLEAPAGFAYMPNKAVYLATLKAFFETNSISIEGLNKGLEVESSDTPVGGGGEMQEHPTDVKITRSTLTVKVNEKYGQPFFYFLNGWIRYLIMDPNTKIAAVTTLSTNAPTDMLADVYSATVLFIEPDPKGNKVQNAWLGTNIWPKGTGELVGRKDKTAAFDQVDRDIQFAGIFSSGAGVDAMAQTILDKMSMVGANPMLQAAFANSIAADIAAASGGYAAGIEKLSSNAISL